MTLTIVGTFLVAALAAVLLVAPLMYSLAALVRRALLETDEGTSELRLALLPALAELCVAVTFTAAVTGGVSAMLQRHPEAPPAWMWAAGFVVAALPGVVRWIADFLADPGGDPSALPGWLETPLMQSAAFAVFAAWPPVTAAAWASVAVIGASAAGLKAVQARSGRGLRFVPAGDVEGPASIAAGAGR
jgi:hypothetical protein